MTQEVVKFDELAFKKLGFLHEEGQTSERLYRGAKGTFSPYPALRGLGTGKTVFD